MMRVVVSGEAAAIPEAGHLAGPSSVAILRVCQTLYLEGERSGAGLVVVEEASSASEVPVAAAEAASA